MSKISVRQAIIENRPITHRDFSFSQWKQAVDILVQRKAGLSLSDLNDCPTADWFDQGISAKIAASKAIRYSGGY